MEGMIKTFVECYNKIHCAASKTMVAAIIILKRSIEVK